MGSYACSYFLIVNLFTSTNRHVISKTPLSDRSRACTDISENSIRTNIIVIVYNKLQVNVLLFKSYILIFFIFLFQVWISLILKKNFTSIIINFFFIKSLMTIPSSVCMLQDFLLSYELYAILNFVELIFDFSLLRQYSL